VDGIVLDPYDVRALTAAVKDVFESGIPVVSFNRYVEGANKPVPFFCLDDVAGAAALAQSVIDKFPNGAKIVFITGKPGGSAAIDRVKGVHDTIKAPGEKYKIVAEQTANGHVRKASL